MLLKNSIEINTYTDEDIDTCENTEVWVLEVGDMGPGGALHRSVPKGPVSEILGIPCKVIYQESHGALYIAPGG